MPQATMNIMSFYNQDMNHADPDSVYNAWLDFNKSIKGIDPALDNWFYLAKATPDEVVYFDAIKEKEKVISSVLRKKSKGNNVSRNDVKGARFRAWSKRIPAKGPENEREDSLVAFSSLTGGTDRRPARFHLEVTELQDAPSEKEMEAFTRICKSISGVTVPIWLNACPSAYIDYAVFPHRHRIGWMAVVPGADISGELSFLAYDEYLPDIGTLIVTTKDRFSILNPEHIEASQAAEVALNKLGLLPEAR
ncbi:Imm52 family immunity protein [Halomonas huangheensis]|uniref:Imm52 family immunity protein n=1 Tax=Halomonas huangheensis TaxID=1178482 RepID=UPI000B0D0F9F|nr:Imm52 family immunity protein [Halomonas huangheensis]